jgi:transcriptional regulator with XRE-family HTH domain
MDATSEALIDFIAAVKVARERAGLSVTQAAERAGMAYPNWLRFENGRATNPTVQLLEVAARAVGGRLELRLIVEAST